MSPTWLDVKPPCDLDRTVGRGLEVRLRGEPLLSKVTDGDTTGRRIDVLATRR
jgi:hypothetical protein